ncbi:MAG: RNA polymerase factor sigma-54, partial [Betaproteobacteria bacterium]|nr:RNA polymerase factor sigma-54 [Betaproteobacteria bacterium]
MKPTLQFRIAQQLTLTPQLQQAIRMLQMSSLELAQELEQALRDNPFLERSDESLDSFGSGDFQAA